jgi:hypothetical protein
MTTQAQGPAQAQAQQPVHPIHQEQETHARLTEWVKNNPDNDPHEGTDMEEPKAPQQEAQEPQAEAQTEEQVETVEFDEETPFFDLEYNGEKQKLSAKQIREGYLAKQDYHRNIQKVKAQEAEITQKVQQAQTQAAQHYLQQLEVQKQALARLANVKSMPEIEALAKEDPAAAQQEFLRFINVNQTFQQIAAQQQQVAAKLQADQKQALEQMKLKTRETLETDIKGWNADLYNKVLATAVKDYGFKNEEVEPVVDARLIKLFHDAHLYRQLQQAKPEISKKVVAVPKVVKPGSADKPNTSSSTDEAAQRLKKTGRGEDFVSWYLAQQKQQKRK